MIRHLGFGPLVFAVASGVTYGSTLSGTVRTPGDAPLGGAPVRVVDAFAGTVASPADLRTDVEGRFAITVSDGVFDLFVLPDPSTRLAARTQLGVAVAGNTDLGVLSVEAGYAVVARVLDPDGAGVADAHVDVYDAATGEPVAIAGGASDGTGAESLVVAAGVYRFVVEPPIERGLAHREDTDVSVSSDRSFDFPLERTPVAARLEPAGRLVAPGGNVYVDAFVRNDSLASQAVTARVVFEDPSRHAVSALTSPTTRMLGPAPRTRTFRFGFNIPPNTPDVFRGHALHFRLLLKDAASGVVIDADRSAFEIE